MNYVTGLTFEEAPDFGRLKQLIVDAADESRIDLFDNVFDWSIKLTKRKISSNPIANPDSFLHMAKDNDNSPSGMSSNPARRLLREKKA